MRQFFVITCDGEVVLVADSMFVAEILVGHLEEDDIKETGCERDYQIVKVPFYMNAAVRITLEAEEE